MCRLWLYSTNTWKMWHVINDTLYILPLTRCANCECFLQAARQQRSGEINLDKTISVHELKMIRTYFHVNLILTFAYFIFWSIFLDLLLQLVKILPHLWNNLIFQVLGSRVALAEGDAVTLICRWLLPSPWRWPWIWPWRSPWLIDYDPTHDFCHH